MASLFFLRFWRETRDRLFSAFALGFGFEALSRAALAISAQPHDASLLIHLTRALAYGIILAGVLDKNLRPRGRP